VEVDFLVVDSGRGFTPQTIWSLAGHIPHRWLIARIGALQGRNLLTFSGGWRRSCVRGRIAAGPSNWRAKNRAHRLADRVGNGAGQVGLFPGRLRIVTARSAGDSRHRWDHRLHRVVAHAPFRSRGNHSVSAVRMALGPTSLTSARVGGGGQAGHAVRASGVAVMIGIAERVGLGGFKFLLQHGHFLRLASQRPRSPRATMDASPEGKI